MLPTSPTPMPPLSPLPSTPTPTPKRTRYLVTILSVVAVLGIVVFFAVSLSAPKGVAPQPVIYKPTRSATTTPIAGKILFIARPDGKVDHVYTMSADGTGVTQLTSGQYSDQTAEWSFDGKKIVFHRNTADGPAIYTMNADGSNPARLSPSPGRDVLPAWTPSGQIVYSHVVTLPTPGSGFPKTSIMIMNADGTGAKTLLDQGEFDVEPRVSPDGTKIIFGCERNRGLQVCIMNADGSDVKQLTNSGMNSADPHWSHDGSKISFGSDREGGGLLNFYTMNPDGSGVAQITHFPLGQESGDTSWSRDDKFIAFEWDVNGKKQSDPDAHAEVWIVGADGSNPYTTGVDCSGVGCAPRFQP